MEMISRPGLGISTLPSRLVLIALYSTSVAAQNCISLSGSTACPAFNASSISTSPNVTALFPFLADVTDQRSFDTQLFQYMSGSYVQEKYQTLFGCSAVNLENTTDLYARYSTSFVCNAVVQNSIDSCGVNPSTPRPLCADTCAEFALNEESIVSSVSLCNSTFDNAAVLKQLRADYTNCALPAEAITGYCIPGYLNERENCGFQSNLDGLCAYCGSSSINSTDSCCVTSNAESRCSNVVLPVFTPMGAIFTTSTSSTPTTFATATATATTTSSIGAQSTSTAPLALPVARHSLSDGAIAGIVIGSVLGAGLLLALLLFLCLGTRRKEREEHDRIENLMSKPRSGPSAAGVALPPPGGRVMGISALEGSEKSSPAVSPSRRQPLPPQRVLVANPGANNSPTNELEKAGSSNSSTQLNTFKDYYSEDYIHPNDTVSTLWAYQPRAPDEFELERGDTLRIIGMWDDGWATGVRLPQRAEDWSSGRGLRDSVVSNSPRHQDSPPTSWQVKAFPLVCVCLPQHYSKTIASEHHPPIAGPHHTTDLPTPPANPPAGQRTPTR